MYWEGICYFLALTFSYHRFNRRAMKSLISFSRTYSGCSLVLHNLLDEDTGPLGAVAKWPDTLARGGRSVQQRAAKHGLLRSPVWEQRALTFSYGKGLTSSLQPVLFSGSIFFFFLFHFGEDTGFWQQICTQIIVLVWLCWVRFCWSGNQCIY